MATNLRLQTSPPAQSEPQTEPPLKGSGSMSTRDGAIAAALGVYLLICSGLTLQLLAHVWSGSLDLLQVLFFGLALDESHLSALQPFSYAACGAVLGAIILSFRGLHKHAVVQRSFRSSYSGSYLIGPWAAGLLGVTTYVMLRGGLLVFGGEQGTADETAAHAYLALGILTGFSWERMLARIDDAARQLFGRRVPRDETGGAARAG